LQDTVLEDLITFSDLVSFTSLLMDIGLNYSSFSMTNRRLQQRLLFLEELRTLGKLVVRVLNLAAVVPEFAFWSPTHPRRKEWKAVNSAGV